MKNNQVHSYKKGASTSSVERKKNLDAVNHKLILNQQC